MKGGFSINGGPGGIMQPPTRVNGNRGQQILQLATLPPPTPDLGKKSQASNERAQYTSIVAKTKEFTMNEKFITFPQDHQLPSKDELKRKVYCKKSQLLES